MQFVDKFREKQNRNKIVSKMFSQFILSNNNNKPKSRPDGGLNNHSMSDRSNYCSGKFAEKGKNGGFWSTNGFRSLWTSRSQSASKCHYKDIVQDRYYAQQRHRLIDDQPEGEEKREIELDYFNDPPPPPTPPMSPSHFMLPRCMQEQCFSPVKLCAAQEEERKPRRIKFRPVDSETLIEKFDKISIMAKSGQAAAAAVMEDDKENESGNSVGVGKAKGTAEKRDEESDPTLCKQNPCSPVTAMTDYELWRGI